ncbi:hypothetical protein [Candidatus Sulfurimonas baltica]|uniref:Lipocalin-like domain-containing protein n=1 Tax=Candidatus Sulfurimonas baltica TaxID=2740404 RepID=A0A7S7RN57_9BACT|nr:hypothetical protein [Candidatus Sulfurimonas baltica]QOY52977.1 hypothetical protein HUE88_04650 [Candidatus Sulfurimonas baltica]
MKFILIVSIIFLNFINADEVVRKCTKNDLIGTWSVTHIKLIDKDSKDSLSHFLMKNQILVFKKNNEIRSLYSYSRDNSFDIKKAFELLEVPQGDTYKIENGVISYFRDNKQIDSAKCDYFNQDLKKANIDKGSISLMRFSKGKQAVGNVYEKINP